MLNKYRYCSLFDILYLLHIDIFDVNIDGFLLTMRQGTLSVMPQAGYLGPKQKGLVEVS